MCFVQRIAFYYKHHFPRHLLLITWFGKHLPWQSTFFNDGEIVTATGGCVPCGQMARLMSRRRQSGVEVLHWCPI